MVVVVVVVVVDDVVVVVVVVGAGVLAVLVLMAAGVVFGTAGVRAEQAARSSAVHQMTVDVTGRTPRG